MNPPETIRNYNLVLASGSPRRRELMKMLDIPFAIARLIEVDESYPPTLAPDDVALYLSRLKAEAYRSVMKENDLYITADTVVILGDRVIGKPHDERQAVEMLKALSGRSHRVVTGVSLFTRRHIESFKATTQVNFAEIPDPEIEAYVREYSPLDKAGAYGIQEWIGAVGIKEINGSFYNVMGLPVHQLWKALKEFDKD